MISGPKRFGLSVSTEACQNGPLLLRSVTWVLPRIADRGFEQSSNSYLDWLDTIGGFESEINLPRLDIALDCNQQRICYDSDNNGNNRNIGENRPRRPSEACATAKLLTESSIPPGQSKSLLVHLRYPWRAYPLFPGGLQEIPEKQFMIEKRVRGGDGYNGILRGKCKRRQRWNGNDCGRFCGECAIHLPGPTEGGLAISRVVLGKPTINANGRSADSGSSQKNALLEISCR